MTAIHIPSHRCLCLERGPAQKVDEYSPNIPVYYGEKSHSPLTRTEMLKTFRLRIRSMIHSASSVFMILKEAMGHLPTSVFHGKICIHKISVQTY